MTTRNNKIQKIKQQLMFRGGLISELGSLGIYKQEVKRINKHFKNEKKI